MAMSPLIKIALIIVLLEIFLYEMAEFAYGPKLNISSYEYVLKTGENFAVLCEGNGPLEWDLEDEEDNGEYSQYTTRETKITIPQNEEFTNALEMRISNITFPYVGIYYCMEKGNHSNATAALYLYVDDPYYLAATDVMFDRITPTTQGSTVTLPCIPAAPDVEVTLMKEIDGQMIPIELDSSYNGKFYDYSQFSGITTDDTTQIELSVYRCSFRRGNYSVDFPVSVDVEPKTYSISKPTLYEMNLTSRNIVGGTIVLRCEVKTHVTVEFTWTVPQYNENELDLRMETLSPERDTENPDLMYSTLTITNSSLEDNGRYKCKVADYQDHEDESILNITILDHLHILLIEEGCSVEKKRGIQNIKCSVGIISHPLPNITWRNDKNESIPFGALQNHKKINSTYMKAWLEIRNVIQADVGYYTLLAENEYDIASLKYFVDVIEKPKIELILGRDYQFLDAETMVQCIVSAYPKPSVVLMYKPCLDDSCDYEILENQQYEQMDYKLNDIVEYAFPKTGIIKCIASETVIDEHEGEETFEKEIGLFISDIEKGFSIESLGDVESADLYNVAVITHQKSIEIKCAAYKQNFTQKIKWKRDSREIVTNKKFKITTAATEFSDVSILNISHINIDDQGFYTCELYKVTGGNEKIINSQNLGLYMSQYIAPVLIQSNLNSTLEIDDGGKLELICIFEGEPSPITTWYKNNEVITSSDRNSISTDGQRIIFPYTSVEDEGLFSCEGKNSWGYKRKETKLIYKRESGKKWYGIIIGILTILVMIATITTCKNHINKKKLEKLLEEAGLTNFEKGQLYNFNPELEVGDQVELLPYDHKYEFPIKNLKLGKLLGSGAFGVVVMGEARGILPREKVTTVAVKMVDRNAQQVHIKALVAELKILIYLGKHLNVVNLLGACTKNIAKRELLVIEEYCRYGNLRTYLYRNRNNFINQIDPQTEEIDHEMDNDIPDEKEMADDRSWMKLLMHAPNASMSTCYELFPNNEHNNQPDGILSRKHSSSDLSSSDERTLGREGHEDTKELVKSISTRDLLSWGFQVARGMEYLVSRRVLHGDLAARNILLADDDVVKICDFGLAKRTYKIENYKKIADGPLPVKWMAIESIRDRVFSSQSDVWSFGIVLWEFFSLAKTPYPGMEADEKLFEKLEDGYRLEAPEFSSKSIYQIMMDCWSANPLNRPTFTTLSKHLGSMLEDSVRKHYIRLNDPYLMMNAERLQDQNDYLTRNLSSYRSYQNDIKPSTVYVHMDGSASPCSEKKDKDNESTVHSYHDKASANENSYPFRY